jgi:hypothetical protein
MKNDIYTKIVLTVIAGALVWNVVDGFPRTAQAQQLSQTQLPSDDPIITEPFTEFNQQLMLNYEPPMINLTFRQAVQRVVVRCSVSGAAIRC